MTETTSPSPTPAPAPVKYTRKNPYHAKLKRTVILTGEESEKDTRHYEIDLAGSGMSFEPGDSLAVLATNCEEYVDDLIKALDATGEELVTDPNKNEVSLREALTHSCNITQPDRKFLKTLAEKAAKGDEITALLEPDKKKELSDFLWGREIIDFLFMYPDAKFEVQEFVSLMKKQQVRLYSIASSLAYVPDEVHLTVATVRYESHGRKRKGVCTTFLSDRCEPGTEFATFITPGKGFRMPAADEETPIIMCGPGTGIAPFRAFLQERKATSAKGKAWLFFGDQREASDFLYKEEFEQYLADGTLDKLSTAFSRDQDHKIYVQHRMEENAEEFWEWLENGAIFYVCGDANRMAPDVDAALHRIIQNAGQKSEEEAAAYVEQMKSDKRYRRDVY